MIWVALRMLMGDRAKFFGIVFGVAFATLLMSQQVSIFVSILQRTTSQIRDIREPDIWVMDPNVRFIDEVSPLADTDDQRVRGVPGVEWAAKLFKGQVKARLAEGNAHDASGDFRNVILLGLDDANLVGAPRRMILGSLDDLHQNDAIIIDEAGWSYLWPGEPPHRGKILEMNDKRAIVVGVCIAQQPFQSMGIIYTKYSRALKYAPPERRQLSFVLVKAHDKQAIPQLCQAIHKQTRLQALSSDDFAWQTIEFYLKNTGIPVNFGITVMLGFMVGVAIAGQTFYLFTIENLKQFGSLKAMGVSNLRIMSMILVQALVVGVLGYGIGIGLAGLFFEGTKNVMALKGFHMYWEVMAGSAIAVLFIVCLASLLSIRRVLILEPAIVFR